MGNVGVSVGAVGDGMPPSVSTTPFSSTRFADGLESVGRVVRFAIIPLPSKLYRHSASCSGSSLS